MKKSRILFLMIITFMSMILNDCTSLKKIKELEKRLLTLDYKVERLEEIKDQFSKKIDNNKRKAIADKTRKNTDDGQLKSQLSEHEKRIEKLEYEKGETKKQPKHIDRDIKIFEIQRKIEKLIDEENLLIQRKYNIHRVDFKDINIVDISIDAVKLLESIIGEIILACKSNKKILIFGFSCDIGLEKKIKVISEMRAKNVASWIKSNAKCSSKNLIYEGIGIYLQKEEIVNIAVSNKELDELRSNSRHVEIFIPK